MIDLDFLRKELMTAMKNKDIFRKECLQILISNIRNEEIRLKKRLLEEDVFNLVKKEIKQLNDVISVAKNRNVDEYIKKINIFKEFIPKQLEYEEVLNIVEKECVGMNKKGDIMKKMVTMLRGKTDNSNISKAVDSFLNRQ